MRVFLLPFLLFHLEKESLLLFSAQRRLPWNRWRFFLLLFRSIVWTKESLLISFRNSAPAFVDLMGVLFIICCYVWFSQVIIKGFSKKAAALRERFNRPVFSVICSIFSVKSGKREPRTVSLKCEQQHSWR